MTRRSLAMLAILAIGLIVAACGKSSSNSSANTSSAATTGSSANTGTSANTSTSATTGSSSNTSTGAFASTGCGSVPTLPFHDASGVIAKLGAKYRASYNGNADPIFPSAFAHFKPKSTSDLTIGVAFSQPGNPYQVASIAAVKKDLLGIKGVSHVTVLTAQPTQPTTQIGQVNQLIQEHVAAIVTEPIVPPAMIPLAAKAKAAGIPLVAVLNGIPSPNAVSVAANSVADGLHMAAGIAHLIGGKGSIIGVHGIEATGNDKQAFAGFDAALHRCPNITFAGSGIVGEFQTPVAKQATLTWLTSHPQPVAGALQSATMGSAIIQAFQQTGRPQPALGNIQAGAGDLAYWKAHENTYKSIATGIGPPDLARATAYTVSHILSGHGPKVSELVAPGALITSADLSQWVVPGAGPTSQAVVSGPAGSWMPDSYLAPLFNK